MIRRKNSHRRSNFIPRGSCEQCGEPRRDEQGPAGRFCGRVCMGLAARHVEPRRCHVCDAVIGREAVACNVHRHAERRAIRERPCAVCGGTFVPYPSATLRGGGKFCSLACYRTSVGARPALLSLQCPQCGQPFRRTQAAVARVRASYCSLACAAVANSGEGSTNWRGGSDPNRGQGWRRLAEQIRERDGFQCRRCGKSQEVNGQRLSVDHVIPWRTFASAAEANDPSNLVSLCRPCHSRKGRAERLWLKGDVLDMWRYQVAVAEPWARPAPLDMAGAT